MMAIGGGVAALGAGAYAFLGPNAKKNQKKAKAWIAKMETVVEKKALPKVVKMEKNAKKVLVAMRKMTKTKVIKKVPRTKTGKKRG
jgi:hypothetical protein